MLTRPVSPAGTVVWSKALNPQATTVPFRHQGQGVPVTGGDHHGSRGLRGNPALPVIVRAPLRPGIHPNGVPR